MRKYVDEELLPHAFEWESAGQVPDAVRKLSFFRSNSTNNIRPSKDMENLAILLSVQV